MLFITYVSCHVRLHAAEKFDNSLSFHNEQASNVFGRPHYTTPEKFENGFFTPKTNLMFSTVHFPGEILKMQQSAS